MDNKIIIGTRRSKLALWQANWVKTLIENLDSRIIVDIKPMRTRGDKITSISLEKVGGKGLFVSEIEVALIEDKIDLAVHSMKDMPIKIPKELCIAAIPKREDPRDVIISKNSVSLMNLKKGAKVGTNSLRRISQLLYWRPDFRIIPLRGNVETRISKINKYNLDAVILASAGLRRLEYVNYISRYIETDVVLPAVGQGALCIEVKKDNLKLREMLSKISNLESKYGIMAERSFLSCLEGGCHVPIAANAVLNGGNIFLDGIVARNGENRLLRSRIVGRFDKSIELGENLAKRLLRAGAKEVYKLKKLVK